MRKATATYNAPDGDSKVVEMGGVRFVDGETTEINSDENSHLIDKLPGNKHFDIDIGEETERPKRCRPSNAEKAAEAAKEKAAQEEAERAKFEQSERDRLAAAAKAT